MTTLKAALAATAIAALLSSSAYAAAEGEDVTSILSQSDTPLSLPSMQPSAGDMNTTTNTTTGTSGTITNTTTGISDSVTNTTTASTTTPMMDMLAGEKMAMRRLWADHISYTRNYIISALGGLGDVNDVEQRLLKNQDDIGAAIKPYYGDDTGNKLSELLRAHIVAVTEIVKAAKDKTRKTQDEALNRANTNAEEIANLFAGANTNWSRTELSASLRQHIDLIAQQVNARVKRDWKSDIDAYDRAEDQVLTLADTLVEGIAKQYPDRFNAPGIQPSTGP